MGVRGQGTTPTPVQEGLAQVQNENVEDGKDDKNHEAAKKDVATTNRLHEILESENEDVDENFHSAPSSKEHSSSPAR